ncbi:MAG: hypothetical protein J5717_02975 [Lachnospiraceae bacterium]|nr:hypothetical protein [Lachnospiraceae bacterium]
MSKKLLITVASASLLAFSLMGCGKKDELPEDFLKETPIVTTTDSVSPAATAQPEEQHEAEAPATETAEASTPEQPADDTEEYEVYAGITRLEAVEYVSVNIGSGGKITDVVKGSDDAGNDAWVITVEPVTTSEGPATVTYHVSDANSFFESGNGGEE